MNMVDLLSEQVGSGLKGDFNRGWEIAQQLERETPACNRAAFNRGWYLLRQGRFFEGNELLNRGRLENVFGNRHPGTFAPIWSGQPGRTVMLNLEGGFGDQIHGYRFARLIQEMGARPIVCCSVEIAELFAENVVVCQHEAMGGVYHNAWLPSMSAAYHLRHASAYNPGPYIVRTRPKERGLIGIRWKGNPKFEHEQHRVFPKELLFEAVEGHRCISLQDDEDGPYDRPDLSSWRATRDAISRCELVITSCTSVAHLAGAMGIETWIVVPVLSYYLWAVPGERTDHYGTVRLFRQERYGEWEKPFLDIRERLNALGAR